MAAVDVLGQFVNQVSLVGDTLGAEVPKVMMGVADGQTRLQRRLLGQRQPVISSKGH